MHKDAEFDDVRGAPKQPRRTRLAAEVTAIQCVLSVVLAVAVSPRPAHAIETSSITRTDASRALVDSVQRGDLQGVERALRRGADINVRDRSGSPLLQVALAPDKPAQPMSSASLRAARLDIARLLLAKGADVRATDAYGFTALHVVARDPSLLSFIDPILRNGADPNAAAAANAARETPLVAAIDGNNFRAMERLLRRGADVDKRIEQGITPLMITTLKNAVASAKILLRHGAAIDAPNDAGMTPLAMAVALGRLEFIDLLIDAGADPDLSVKDRRSPRQMAEQNSREEIRSAFRAAVGKSKARVRKD